MPSSGEVWHELKGEEIPLGGEGSIPSFAILFFLFILYIFSYNEIIINFLSYFFIH